MAEDFSSQIQRLRQENAGLRAERRQLQQQQLQQRQRFAEADGDIAAARRELGAWRRSALLPGRLRGALCGMLLGDALAVPTHYYPDRSSIEKELGPLGARHGFRAPPALHPRALLESARYTGEIDILHSARRFYSKPRRADGKGYHPHRGLAAGENTLSAQLGLRVLLDTTLRAEASGGSAAFVPLFLEAMRSFLVAEGPEGEPASHNDVWTPPWLRSYFERLSAAEAAARVGPRRSAAAAVEHQKRGRQDSAPGSSSPTCDRTTRDAEIPGSMLLFVLPLVLKGAVCSWQEGCIGISAGPLGYAQTVHTCVELVSALVGDLGDEAGVVGDTVSVWCETLWDVLWPLLHATDPEAVIFARAAPTQTTTTTTPDLQPSCNSQSRSHSHAESDPCEALLLQLHNVAEGGGSVNDEDVWVTNVEASCMRGGDCTTSAAVLGGVLGAAVGFDGLPPFLLGTLGPGSEELLAQIDHFVCAVTVPFNVPSKSFRPIGAAEYPAPQKTEREPEAAATNAKKTPASASARANASESRSTSILSERNVMEISSGDSDTIRGRDDVNFDEMGSQDRTAGTSLVLGAIDGTTQLLASSSGNSVDSLDQHVQDQSKDQAEAPPADEINMIHGVATRGPVGLGTWTDTRLLLEPTGVPVPPPPAVAALGDQPTELYAAAVANDVSTPTSSGTADWCSAIGSPQYQSGACSPAAKLAHDMPAQAIERDRPSSRASSDTWSTDSFGSALEFSPAVDGTAG